MFGILKKLLAYWTKKYKHVESHVKNMFDFKSLLQQSEIGKSRSSVINPLQWTIVIVFVGLLAVTFEHGPPWLLIVLTCLLVAIVILLILAYIYFAIKDPDALRSEKYVLVKAALEKSYAGDNLSGLHEVIKQFDDPGQDKLLPNSDVKNLGSGT
jgi:hypothetical protein